MIMGINKRLWWNRLENKEQDILISLLYDLDLNEYVEMDEDGNILGRMKYQTN